MDSTLSYLLYFFLMAHLIISICCQGCCFVILLLNNSFLRKSKLEILYYIISIPQYGPLCPHAVRIQTEHHLSRLSCLPYVSYVMGIDCFSQLKSLDAFHNEKILWDTFGIMSTLYFLRKFYKRVVASLNCVV